MTAEQTTGAGLAGVPAEATVLAAGSILKVTPDHAAARRVLLAGLEHRKTHVRGLALEHHLVEALHQRAHRGFAAEELKGRVLCVDRHVVTSCATRCAWPR